MCGTLFQARAPGLWGSGVLDSWRHESRGFGVLGFWGCGLRGFQPHHPLCAYPTLPPFVRRGGSTHPTSGASYNSHRGRWRGAEHTDGKRGWKTFRPRQIPAGPSGTRKIHFPGARCRHCRQLRPLPPRRWRNPKIGTAGIQRAGGPLLPTMCFGGPLWAGPGRGPGWAVRQGKPVFFHFGPRENRVHARLTFK